MIVLIIFLFTAILARLLYLQLFSSERLQVKAIDQWTRDVPITGERGDIYDRNGILLADTATTYTIYVRPNSVSDKVGVARMLSRVLGVDEKKLYDRLNSRVSEVTVSKKVSGEQINQIYQSRQEGIYYAQNIERKYIFGDFSPMVLGFTNVDGVGQTGIEAYYNSYLQGIDGKILTETDLVGRELDTNVNQYIEGIKGADVYLTIDYSIQNIVQSAVNDAYEKHAAKSVSCVMLNAMTGEVLAMAQTPSFDLNHLPRDDVAMLLERSKNTLITNVYEPGSTFKILTAAIGLETGVVSENTHVFCPGYRIVDGKRIKCWKTIGHGSQTFAEGVQNSCNCMFMDMALGVGTEKMYEWLQKIGITDKTGIDMSGEGRGLMIDESLVKNVDLARIGFGQAVAVTALELVTACAAVVNGGNLLKPYVVDRIERNGKVVFKGEKEIKRQVICENTSKIMRNVLEGVVANGGGKNAQVTGYRIGGKTGTAQKYGAGGAIAAGKYVSTFLGFAPADDPKYILLFIVDEPSTGIYYGSLVAAPYASRIFHSVFQYIGLESGEIKEEERFEMPLLTGMTLQEADKIMRQMDLYYEYVGDNSENGVITYQIPAPKSLITKKQSIYLEIS